jgi:hypothetical protein
MPKRMSTTRVGRPTAATKHKLQKRGGHIADAALPYVDAEQSDETEATFELVFVPSRR